jgi:hypothetical protein
MSQLIKLRDLAVVNCVKEIRVQVPANVALILFEATYMPLKSAIPYELAKQVIETDKPKRCSHYIKPILLACPKILSPYAKPKG